MVVPWRRPPEVYGLAGMWAIACAALATVAVKPPLAGSPVGVYATISAVALTTVLVLLALPEVPAWLLHAGIALWLSLVTVVVAVAAAPVSSAAAAIAYTWSSFYTAHFFSARAARSYAALTSVALAAALVAQPRPGDPLLWVMVTLTAVVGSEVLMSLHGRLRRAAVTDELTGVYNRAGLTALASRQVAGARRTGAPLCVAVLDLDDFKQVNDRHGHAAGDQLLVALARAWAGALRPADQLFRSGGDEFVLLLPATTPEQAERVLARLRRVSPAGWSSGLAVLAPDDSFDACLARADRSLYDAKQRRRLRSAAVGG